MGNRQVSIVIDAESRDMAKSNMICHSPQRLTRFDYIQAQLCVVVIDSSEPH